MTSKPILFRDRIDAGKQLAEELARWYRDHRPLVLAIQVEAVPIAQVVAERLHGELEFYLADDKRRRELVGDRPVVSASRRVVILVSEGITTGASAKAALRAIRKQGPQELVVAAPVASRDALELLDKEADEIMVLHSQLLYYSTEEFYDLLPRVTEDEVVQAFSPLSRAA